MFFFYFRKYQGFSIFLRASLVKRTGPISGIKKSIKNIENKKYVFFYFENIKDFRYFLRA
jgi:hypothetical protein